MASAAVAAAARDGGPGGRATIALAGMLLATAALVDVHEHRLPNRLLAAAALAALASAGLEHRLGVAITGLALAAGLLLVVRLARGIGMGDVKMAGVVGAGVASNGLVAAPVAVAVAALAAATAGALLVRSRLPFGPSLWLGWAVGLVLPIGRWWW